MKQIFVPFLAEHGKENTPSYRHIGMEEAQDMMQTEKDYIILDVRTEMEFDQGHIPGAINIPNEQISTKKLAELPDENRLIFVYCRSGSRSKNASEKLAMAGYKNITEFGGILDWPGEISTD